jgi:hypothetical protein
VHGILVGWRRQLQGAVKTALTSGSEPATAGEVEQPVGHTA